MKRDEVKIGQEIAPKVFAGVRRQPDGKTERVALHMVEDGMPLMPDTELVDVHLPPDEEGWCRVEPLYKSGPAQVATPQYREGHDRIFGKKQKAGLA